MKNNLKEIFAQAQKDNYSVKINGNGYESVILYNTKLVRDNKTQDVIALNCYNDSHYYSNMKVEDLAVSISEGWKPGCYRISLKKHINKLKVIEVKLQKEIIKDSSKKEIQRYEDLKNHSVKKIEELKRKLKIGNEL